MGALGIVVATGTIDDHAGLKARSKPLHTALVETVLPRLARIDVGELDTSSCSPILEQLDQEIGTVSHAKRSRCAELSNGSLENAHHASRTNAARDVQRDRLAGALVDEHEDP